MKTTHSKQSCVWRRRKLWHIICRINSPAASSVSVLCRKKGSRDAGLFPHFVIAPSALSIFWVRPRAVFQAGMTLRFAKCDPEPHDRKKRRNENMPARGVETPICAIHAQGSSPCSQRLPGVDSRWLWWRSWYSFCVYDTVLKQKKGTRAARQLSCEKSGFGSGSGLLPTASEAYRWHGGGLCARLCLQLHIGASDLLKSKPQSCLLRVKTNSTLLGGIWVCNTFLPAHRRGLCHFLPSFSSHTLILTEDKANQHAY